MPWPNMRGSPTIAACKESLPNSTMLDTSSQLALHCAVIASNMAFHRKHWLMQPEMTAVIWGESNAVSEI